MIRLGRAAAIYLFESRQGLAPDGRRENEYCKHQTRTTGGCDLWLAFLFGFRRRNCVGAEAAQYWCVVQEKLAAHSCATIHENHHLGGNEVEHGVKVTSEASTVTSLIGLKQYL